MSRSCVHCNRIIFATVLRALLRYTSVSDNFRRTASDAPLIFLKSINSEIASMYPKRPPCPSVHSSCKWSINLRNRFGEHRLKSITSNVNCSLSSQQNFRNLKHLFATCWVERSFLHPPPLPVNHLVNTSPIWPEIENEGNTPTACFAATFDGSPSDVTGELFGTFSSGSSSK